jgi:hypothetical protein
MTTHITKGDVLSIPLLKIAFENEQYGDLFDAFILNVNRGVEVEVPVLINKLIERTVHYRGVSMTYRTIAFDFAWAILEENPHLWNDKERETGFSDLASHWKEFYPEDDGQSEHYEVATLEYGEYFVSAMDMIFVKNEIPKDYIPHFSYATYVFFKRWQFQYNDRVIADFKEAMSNE